MKTMRRIAHVLIFVAGFAASAQTQIGVAVQSSTATGTVTSVALTTPAQLSVTGSPVTTSGTLALSWASQNANLVFGSPDGLAGSPTFRSLVAADIPTLPASKISGTAIVEGDARLTNARTPTAHASSHASAGSDAVTLAESQITNLVSDLAGKQATGNYITALTGDVVATGPGSVAATIQANSVALGTDTTGGYAASTTEAGPATTATALDANPTDCSAGQFANAIAASGNLTCAAIASGDLPSTIAANTSGNAATSTALAANPADCSAGQFANAIAANGNLTCASVSMADVPSTDRWLAYTTLTNDTATSFTGIGQSNPGSSGTMTAFLDSTGQYVNCATAAVVDSVANHRTTGLFQWQQRPDATFVIKTGTDLTNARYWIGIGGGGTAIGSGTSDDPNAYAVVAFTYSTAVDGSTFWRIYSNDGTTGGTRTATSVAIAADTRYVFRIAADTATSVRMFINGTLVGTITTELPPGATTMGLYSQITTLDGNAKSIRNGKTTVIRY